MLRYSNPVGAHESGKLGEDPKTQSDSLVPYITEVATGRLSRLGLFGDCYPTPDDSPVCGLHLVLLLLLFSATKDWDF